MKISQLEFPHGLFLAPMAGVTDVPFRALCKKYGAEGVFTEMVSSRALCYHDKKTAIGREKCEKFGREAMEVSDEVFEGAQSVVFAEAENRMHTIKAVLAAMIGGAGV